MTSELEAQAAAKFVDEDYEEAVDLYSQALEREPAKASLYSGRAAAHIKLENYTDAVADANKAIEIDATLSKAHLRKGIACFQLEEYQTAKAAFQAGLNLEPANSTLKTWIRKCDVELQEEAGGAPSVSATIHNGVGAHEAVATDISPASTSAPPLNGTVDSTQVASTPPNPPKYRHEWYQSPTDVVVTVFAKGIDETNLQVDFGDQTLSVVIGAADEEPYALQLRLFGKILPNESKFVHMKTKIEARLKKGEAIQWTGLEFSARKSVPQPLNFSDERAQGAKYPTSSRKKDVDWDKLEANVKKEEKDEKLEGDAALNRLFQDIYGNADEDTRRAMNKSFVESNGTVLSTNWKDIGKEKVKPHSSS